jgi:pyruvate dehydrogenase E2 component (dihydrolipoamide acetyltransferase)
MAEVLKVPELGEGVDAVDVVRVLVEVGDTVDVDQPVIEVETEKASVEVPAEVAGEVTEIHASVGDSLQAGAPIISVEPTERAAADKAVEATEDESRSRGDGEDDDGPAEDAAKELETGNEIEASPEPQEPAHRNSETSEPADGRPEPDEPGSATGQPTARRWSASESPGSVVPAAPTVRRFAREVGVDIATVAGSGPGGRISIDDVKAHVAQRLGRATRGPADVEEPSLPDFTAWGPVRREPMSKIRSVTARNLSRAWLTAPQVTNNDWADITGLEQIRAQYRDRVEAAGGKLTITAILVKVAASALKVFPTLNASIDPAAGEVVYKDYCHVGVAVDTEHGLLVPVIRDADEKNITQISVELGELAGRARDRKLAPADMQGGTFSISNLGGIGGTGFSPIVNWPEVAILGVSRGLMEPRWNGEDFEPRLILPLSLSYDHRLVDGADAARFLRWIAEALEQPLLLALEG